MKKYPYKTRGLKIIPLTPYPPTLLVARTKKMYQDAYAEIFGETDKLTTNLGGRFSGGTSKKGKWTYLIWFSARDRMIHEIAHVALDVFEEIGADPLQCNNEPFCYLIQHIYKAVTT